MRRTSIALILAAALTTGCTSSGGSSSSADFDGEQEAVANVVDDLVEAASEDDGRRVCQQLFAASLRQKFGSDCQTKVEQAFDDTDTNDLSVREVRVSGNTARAQVDTGRDEEQAERRTFELALEGRDWRITSLG